MLDIAARAVRVGVTTEEIDKIVHAACIERDSYPSPLNYHGFPKSCCTSVNEVICHGIPDARPLQDGDIVNIDITLYHNGFHGVRVTSCRTLTDVLMTAPYRISTRRTLLGTLTRSPSVSFGRRTIR